MEIGDRLQRESSISPEEQARRNAAMPKNGSYLARCIGLWNIGVQDEEWKGEKKKTPKLCLNFELYGPNMLYTFDPAKGPQPWTTFIRVTFSKGTQANLTKILKAWYNGDPVEMAQVNSGKFAMEKVLGKPAMVGVEQKDSKKNPGQYYLSIETITAPVSGMEANMPAQPYNEPFMFDIDKFDINNPTFMDSFFRLPYLIKTMACESHDLREKGITLTMIKERYPDKFIKNSSVAGNIQKIMTAKAGGATYDQFIKGGWTDEAMIAQGYLQVITVAPQAAPAVPVMAPPLQPPQQSLLMTPAYAAANMAPPSASPGTAAPLSPPPQAAPAAPAHQMTAKAGVFTYEQMRAAGWSDQMLLENGYMVQPFGKPEGGDIPF
jgi:hypothetical protein